MQIGRGMVTWFGCLLPVSPPLTVAPCWSLHDSPHKTTGLGNPCRSTCGTLYIHIYMYVLLDNASLCTYDSHGQVCVGEGEEDMEESDEEEAQVQQAAEALLAGEMAPPCLDVTLALRYMTHNGRVTFHQVRACTSWCHLSVG